jgi:formylglycine-generating enzyme required for sulfatase activity
MKMQKWALLWAFAFLLLGCSDDHNGQNYNVYRRPTNFKADTTATAHVFCEENNGGFPSLEACLKAQKFRLKWDRPEDTVGFLGYRIYLDTLPPDLTAGQGWPYVQGRQDLAHIIVANPKAPTDSIIFILGNSGFRQDTSRAGNRRIFVLDSAGRADSTGRMIFGLVPVYGKGTPGQPGISWFVTIDKIPPDPFNPIITPQARGLSMKWSRPRDPTSFFNQSLDSGVIVNYHIRISLGGVPTKDQKDAFRPVISSYLAGGRDLTGSVTDTAVVTDSKVGRDFFLPDSDRFRRERTPGPLDSLRVEFSNLRPQDTLVLMVYAVDSSGNDNRLSAQSVTVRLTDTTEPSLPKLSVAAESVTRNGFIISWTASRDSVDENMDGILEPAANPNANILEYRLSRTLKRDSTEKPSSQDRIDTLISVSTDNAARAVFLDTVRFLPPGTAYILRLYAVDSSGHHSRADSLEIATLPVRFAGPDSLLSCPPGFIPIPGANFHLGDTSQVAQEDEGNRNERPIKKVYMRSFCIEPYEHRDAQGRFVTNVSWKDADSICQSISSAHNTQLCSEAEWERACEGDTIPLVHGIQSETDKPDLLQKVCNQATNDSLMALKYELRNRACLTKEGVYDLAGNFSEWVRDTYRASAYSAVKANDTLDHLTSFSAAKDSLGFRGGNYLIPPSMLISTAQNLARCSNRDFAQQVRPKYRTECRDTTRPRLVVIYGPGLSNHRCLEMPDSLRNVRIADMLPARDTMKIRDSLRILVFKDSSTQAIPLTFKEDTAFAVKKPLEVKFTPLALAAVEFVNSVTGDVIKDTLDALEMKDTTQATLEKIFRREAGSGSWSVRKENGRFQIRFIYAYTVMGTKPAQAYFSNRAIAFRCCSLPAGPSR